MLSSFFSPGQIPGGHDDHRDHLQPADHPGLQRSGGSGLFHHRLSHAPFLSRADGQVCGGGAFVYYSHSLQMLFFSYNSGEREGVMPMLSLQEV